MIRKFSLKLESSVCGRGGIFLSISERRTVRSRELKKHNTQYVRISSKHLEELEKNQSENFFEEQFMIILLTMIYHVIQNIVKN